MALTIIAVVSAFGQSAFANVGVTASTTYGSLVPGAHTNYTIRQDFEYGNGAEPTASTGAGQDLKKWIVDSPAGLVGNPNAIPEATRCTTAQFDPSGVMSPYVDSSCPAGAQVGTAQVYLVSDAASNEVPAGAIVGILQGKIYLLQSSPEVPTTLATRFTSTIYQAAVCSSLPGAPAAPCTIYPKTKSVLAPVTNRSAANNGDTDFRIRTVPAEYNSLPSVYGPTGAPYPHPWFNAGATPLHISRIDQNLFGMADPNATVGDTTDDVPFLSMPSRCDSWDSFAYAIDYTGTGSGSLAMDPNNLGDNYYVKSAANSATPDCSTLPTFGTSASAALSTGSRGAYPGLTVKVGDPAPSGHDQVKKMVTTLPEAVSVNVNALNNVCSEADRNADTCSAAAKIGTATIKTPLISAGLTGRVYMVQGSTPGLPFLSIFVDGPVQFRLDATTKFVGPKFNMIETTFDNLPQTPFTDFTVDITGGSSTSSLLFNRSCPTDGSSPAYGSTDFALTGYANPTVSSSSANSFDGCYGAPTVKTITSCIKQSKQLKVTPTDLIATDAIAKIQLLTGNKAKSLNSRATDKAAPFKFKLTMKKSKYKKGKKYYYGYKVTYKDGHIEKSKSRSFKICK